MYVVYVSNKHSLVSFIHDLLLHIIGFLLHNTEWHYKHSLPLKTVFRGKKKIWLKQHGEDFFILSLEMDVTMTGEWLFWQLVRYSHFPAFVAKCNLQSWTDIESAVACKRSSQHCAPLCFRSGHPKCPSVSEVHHSKFQYYIHNLLIHFISFQAVLILTRNWNFALVLVTYGKLQLHFSLFVSLRF